MTELLFVISLAAIVHFIYESIAAPILRMYQHKRLSALMENLSELDFRSLGTAEKSVFLLTKETVSGCIRNLTRMDFSNYRHCQSEYRTDEELKEKVDCGLRAVSECGQEELRDIFDRCGEIFRAAVLINSGPLFLYGLPLFIFSPPKKGGVPPAAIMVMMAGQHNEDTVF